MDMLTLNDDILHNIAEMLSAAECIPLSSVSRDLHSIARPYVFASITVRTVEQLFNMHDHLIRNIDNRLIWPRGLTVLVYGAAGMAGAAWERPVVDVLAGILEHARELKVLEIYNCEEAICCNALVGEYLTALPNLSDISLFCVGTKTLDVLHRMVSRPKRAVLSGSLKHNRFSTHIARAPVLDNVKELRLYQFDGVPSPQLLSSLSGAHPQVETLHLGVCAVYPCLILFPNIRRLTIHICQFDLPAPGHHIEQRHLGYLAVEPTNLHLISALGIRSDYLRLYTEWQDFDPSEDHELVSAAAVLELGLSLSASYTESSMALAQMISRKLSRVRYLVLTIEESYSAMASWMKDIPSSLSPSQLICITVHVTHPNDRGPSRETWLELLQRLEDAHISAIPSLRFYSQVLGWRHTDNPSETTWRRIEGDGGRRAVRPILSWQGERIHRYLQSPEFCRTLRFDEEAALQYTGRSIRRES
ncbi:uncharacterized protein B0H18DRAFT_1107214 [Fomitopsis serialis]|uniref:uncharacterized protein n=1 Tax=Fomitopsis serialis TaxID=139415 RepID=UPI002007A58E|nr:uncharacterized protein B0H18DRAFT_1107214 [Neoantrodia serialis]KAH9917535.1 hypothetical protein B0H18DRAFT_1107214 [Neoantrodia serialis]